MRTINFSGEYNQEFGQNVRSMFMIRSVDNLSSFVSKEALRNKPGVELSLALGQKPQYTVSSAHSLYVFFDNYCLHWHAR